jgi:hypothetical protein
MVNVPVKVGAWVKATAGWRRVSEIQTWTDFDLEPRYLQPGPWSIRMPYDAQTFKLGKTNLLTFDFRGTRMTGVIDKIGPRSDETGALMLEASGADALVLLGDARCWPDPASPLATQNVARYYATGAAETVLRNLIVANMVTRRKDDIVVAPSQGRGGTIGLSEDFSNLLEVVLLKCESAGLGIRMGLVDTGSSTRAEMQVEFFTPEDRSRRVRLSHKVGTLRTWKQEDTAPTGTHAILVAAKEETAYAIASTDVANNSMTIVSPEVTPPEVAGHRFKTGSLVRFGGAGTVPVPLIDYRTYYAIRVDSDTFKLATTASNASKGIAIDLTTVHSGSVGVVEVTRKLREYRNTAVEGEWSRKRELLVSASVADTNEEASYTTAGTEALLGATAQSAFELESAEAEGMRYGQHYGLGDTVTVELLTGLSKVDQLRAVKLKATASEGLTVQLVPGNPDAVDPMFAQAATFRAMRRQIEALERRES